MSESRRPFSPFVLALALLLASTGVAAAFDPQPPAPGFDIEVDSGLLTLTARDAALTDVVVAIGEIAGFETVIETPSTRRVTISLQRVPLTLALTNLLSGTDHVTLYAPAGEDGAPRTLSQVWLLGESELPAGDPPAGAEHRETAEARTDSGKTRSEDLLRLTGQGATPEVLDTLADALQWDAEALVRTRAAMALGALGDARAVPALESALRDEHPTVRRQALQALSQIPDQAATQALGDVLLYEADSRLRALAARGLWRQDSELARALLVEAADDIDQQVREAVSVPPPSIGKSAEPRAVATHGEFESAQ